MAPTWEWALQNGWSMLRNARTPEDPSLYAYYSPEGIRYKSLQEVRGWFLANGIPLRDPQQGVSPDPQQGLFPDPQQGVVYGPQQEVIADPQQGVFYGPQQGVIADPQQEVIADAQKEVIAQEVIWIEDDTKS